MNPIEKVEVVRGNSHKSTFEFAESLFTSHGDLEFFASKLHKKSEKEIEKENDKKNNKRAKLAL